MMLADTILPTQKVKIHKKEQPNLSVFLDASV